MLWLIKATRGYDLTSKPQTLEALQNAFILVYRCKIYLCFDLFNIFIYAYFFITIISLLHTLNAFVPYGYVVILSNVCNLLSSLLVSAILFTSSAYIIWRSLLNLSCDLNMILLLNNESLNLILRFIMHFLVPLAFLFFAIIIH